MEKLTYKYNALIKSQKAFERALNLFKEQPGHTIAELEAYTASVIKHFELFYEMLWKFYKFYLLDKFGIETTGSKSIFRACFDKKIITENELSQLIEIVEIRNETTHIYSEENARHLSEKISTYYQILKKLTESIKI